MKENGKAITKEIAQRALKDAYFKMTNFEGTAPQGLRDAFAKAYNFLEQMDSNLASRMLDGLLSSTLLHLQNVHTYNMINASGKKTTLGIAAGKGKGRAQ